MAEDSEEKTPENTFVPEFANNAHMVRKKDDSESLSPEDIKKLQNNKEEKIKVRKQLLYNQVTEEKIGDMMGEGSGGGRDSGFSESIKGGESGFSQTVGNSASLTEKSGSVTEDSPAGPGTDFKIMLTDDLMFRDGVLLSPIEIKSFSDHTTWESERVERWTRFQKERRDGDGPNEDEISTAVREMKESINDGTLNVNLPPGFTLDHLECFIMSYKFPRYKVRDKVLVFDNGLLYKGYVSKVRPLTFAEKLAEIEKRMKDQDVTEPGMGLPENNFVYYIHFASLANPRSYLGIPYTEYNLRYEKESLKSPFKRAAPDGKRRKTRPGHRNSVMKLFGQKKRATSTENVAYVKGVPWFILQNDPFSQWMALMRLNSHLQPVAIRVRYDMVTQIPKCSAPMDVVKADLRHIPKFRNYDLTQYTETNLSEVDLDGPTGSISENQEPNEDGTDSVAEESQRGTIGSEDVVGSEEVVGSDEVAPSHVEADLTVEDLYKKLQAEEFGADGTVDESVKSIVTAVHMKETTGLDVKFSSKKKERQSGGADAVLPMTKSVDLAGRAGQSDRDLGTKVISSEFFKSPPECVGFTPSDLLFTPAPNGEQGQEGDEKKEKMKVSPPVQRPTFALSSMQWNAAKTTWNLIQATVQETHQEACQGSDLLKQIKAQVSKIGSLAPSVKDLGVKLAHAETALLTRMTNNQRRNDNRFREVIGLLESATGMRVVAGSEPPTAQVSPGGAELEQNPSPFPLSPSSWHQIVSSNLEMINDLNHSSSGGLSLPGIVLPDNTNTICVDIDRESVDGDGEGDQGMMKECGRTGPGGSEKPSQKEGSGGNRGAGSNKHDKSGNHGKQGASNSGGAGGAGGGSPPPPDKKQPDDAVPTGEEEEDEFELEDELFDDDLELNDDDDDLGIDLSPSGVLQIDEEGATDEGNKNWAEKWGWSYGDMIQPRKSRKSDYYRGIKIPDPAYVPSPSETDDTSPQKTPKKKRRRKSVLGKEKMSKVSKKVPAKESVKAADTDLDTVAAESEDPSHNRCVSSSSDSSGETSYKEELKKLAAETSELDNEWERAVEEAREKEEEEKKERNRKLRENRKLDLERRQKDLEKARKDQEEKMRVLKAGGKPASKLLAHLKASKLARKVQESESSSVETSDHEEHERTRSKKRGHRSSSEDVQPKRGCRSSSEDVRTAKKKRMGHSGSARSSSEDESVCTKKRKRGSSESSSDHSLSPVQKRPKGKRGEDSDSSSHEKECKKRQKKETAKEAAKRGGMGLRELREGESIPAGSTPFKIGDKFMVATPATGTPKAPKKLTIQPPKAKEQMAKSKQEEPAHLDNKFFQNAVKVDKQILDGFCESVHKEVICFEERDVRSSAETLETLADFVDPNEVSLELYRQMTGSPFKETGRLSAGRYWGLYSPYKPAQNCAGICSAKLKILQNPKNEFLAYEGGLSKSPRGLGGRLLFFSKPRVLFTLNKKFSHKLMVDCNPGSQVCQLVIGKLWQHPDSAKLVCCKNFTLNWRKASSWASVCRDNPRLFAEAATIIAYRFFDDLEEAFKDHESVAFLKDMVVLANRMVSNRKPGIRKNLGLPEKINEAEEATEISDDETGNSKQKSNLKPAKKDTAKPKSTPVKRSSEVNSSQVKKKPTKRTIVRPDVDDEDIDSLGLSRVALKLAPLFVMKRCHFETDEAYVAALEKLAAKKVEERKSKAQAKK